MAIQNLSICVPAKRCINNCKFCCCKMCEDSTDSYYNCYDDLLEYTDYVKNLKKTMKYARDSGCEVLMLTGDNEPQQNIGFLKVLAEVNKSLPKPFTNIEMQTTGAFIERDTLAFLVNTVGITTLAISVAGFDPKENIELIGCEDKFLNPVSLGILARRTFGIKVRLCINLNDNIFPMGVNPNFIDSFANLMAADQIMCRKLWSEDNGSSQYLWIRDNVTAHSDQIFHDFKESVKEEGTLVDILPYGLGIYKWRDKSVVLDTDSMAQEERTDDELKYLIFRPDGKAYSNWNSKDSLVVIP